MVRAWDEDGGRGPLLFGDGVKVGGRGGAEMHRQRVRVVSTSFTSSVSLARSHWGRKGPDRADLKVRGEPEGSRLRTGAPAEDERGRDDEGGKYHVGVEGTGGGEGKAGVDDEDTR